MDQLDVYYRALRDLRGAVEQDRDCRSFNRAMAEAGVENDSIVVKKNSCTVDEDWIEAIEAGLVFVEKAIKEERQFIYSNGEVVPIEKVKHVSKDSVQHLAKHSNLITKEQEGEDIIPDQLYSVERLNDYAVYENRFLYMLLCYLRDFITIRYNKILEISGRYEGSLQLKKEVTLVKQRISYTVTLNDERKDDKYLLETNTSKEVIDRIDLILKTVMAFLSTPLMEVAGKAAKLKPPITKTNVLKMDNNFKGAVALYDYIIAYDKPGYTVESRDVSLAPFSTPLAEELSYAGAILSFVTYEYGLSLGGRLKNSFDAEEERRKAERVRQNEEQLELLKKKLLKMECSTDDYLLALEKQNKLMQSENRQLEPLREKVAELKEREEALGESIKALKAEGAELRVQMAEAETAHMGAMEALKSECEDRIHANLVAHEEEMRALEQRFTGRIEELGARMREQADMLNSRIEEEKKALSESEKRYAELEARYAELLEEKRFACARVKAMRALQGENIDEDSIDKDTFDELERELEAFVKFYEKQWGKAKKSIRKKLLNYQSLKE